MAKKSKDEPEAKRYYVEYLDWAKGHALMVEGCKKHGDDPEHATLWDYCDQSEITVLRPFPSKEAALAWTRQNAKLDVFNMPRVREQTLTLYDTDDRSRPISPTLVWDPTGY
jgi:hypothetical protein